MLGSTSNPSRGERLQTQIAGRLINHSSDMLFCCSAGILCAPTFGGNNCSQSCGLLLQTSDKRRLTPASGTMAATAQRRRGRSSRGRELDHLPLRHVDLTRRLSGSVTGESALLNSVIVFHKACSVGAWLSQTPTHRALHLQPCTPSDRWTRGHLDETAAVA